MRTTITLEPDVDSLLQQVMRERGVSLKRAVNDAIRAGLRPSSPSNRFVTPTFAMGEPRVDITKALALADALEDDEIARKLALGK